MTALMRGPWFALLALVALNACQCAPSEAHVVLDGNTIDVDADAITIARDQRIVWQMRAVDVGVKRQQATFDMQFGMFDIEADDTPFTFSSALAIRSVDNDSVVVEFSSADTVLATLRVSADRGGVLLDARAAGDNNRIVARTRCGPHDHFIGLGAQSADVDHRGQIVPLWVSEPGIGKVDTDALPTLWQVVGRRHTTSVPMPAFVRSDAVAVVVDTSAFAQFDLCATDTARAAFEVWEPNARVRIFARDTVRAAQQALAGFTGRARVLPPYVFAPWNDAIFGEDSVAELATFLRDSAIPSSVVWTEDWRGGSGGDVYRLDEDWGLDRALYPHYEDMVSALRSAGFVHHVYFNTFVTQGADVFDTVTQAGLAIHTVDGATALFAGADRDFSPTALLDLTNPAARELMKTQHLADALRLGARGWMADFAEWMPVDDIKLADASDPALTHNRYPEMWQQLNLDAITEAGRLDDTLVYYRSGHLGSPSRVDVLWAGDQRTTFDGDDGLPTIIPMGIGTAATGYDYFAHDIGGYQSSTNAPTSKELFFRWAALGAFSPVMRTHHGTHARLNHNLRTDVETTAHYKRYAQIHMRLYPYLRALALANHPEIYGDDVGAGSGPLPLWVPMPLLFDDEAVWGVKDQVFLGPSLLVAPVVTDGARARSVVLPAGRFVAFPLPGAPIGSLGASHASFTGPSSLTVDVDITEIAVLMPAGAIVPMTRIAAQTLLVADGIDDITSTTGDRVVVVALGRDGVFTEEDGSTLRLSGVGVTPPATANAQGEVEVVGDAEIVGDGFVFALSAQPTTRNTRILFR